MNLEKRAQIITTFKFTKQVESFHIIPDTNCTREADRFLIVFKSGDSELFEWDQSSESLIWIESDKAREHDCELTGVDYNRTLQLIVTCDIKGCVRLWNNDKKFLREI
jgi:WD40 repeat protein